MCGIESASYEDFECALRVGVTEPFYLCSDMAGFITGENICIDGGMTKQMIYHGDHGWNLSTFRKEIKK
jgi:enoyl-[acyl-carrier-protein] reductase (NADH)